MPTNSLEPRRGTALDLEERIKHYVTSACPDWSDQVQGCSGDELDEYERQAQLASDALPAMYRTYALSFGKNDGGIMARLKWTTDLPNLVGYYEDEYRFEPDEISPLFPTVGYTTGIGDPVRLHLEQSDTSDAPVVHENEQGDPQLICQSWEQAIFVAASKMVASRTAATRIFSASPASMQSKLEGTFNRKLVRAEVVKVAAELGCQESWISGGEFVVACDTTRMLWASVSPTGGVLLYWFDTENQTSTEVERILATRVGREVFY